MERDIQSYTRYVVEKDREYLRGAWERVKWSTSYYDAWRTKDLEGARRVAKKLGGRLMLFNPATGILAQMPSIRNREGNRVAMEMKD